MIFIDSNIPMYVAGREHPHKTPAQMFLQKVQSGKLEACTNTEVLQEILYRYYALHQPQLAHQVYELFVDICPTVLPITLAETDKAKTLLQQHKFLSVRDALHAATMFSHDISRIATFDSDFDQIPGIQRYKV